MLKSSAALFAPIERKKINGKLKNEMEDKNFL
jgi:hypothetical protein